MNVDESVQFDQDADALYVRLLQGNVARTISLDDHRLVDVGDDGSVLGVEFIDVSGGIDLELPGFPAETTARLQVLLVGHPFKTLV